MAMRRGMAAIAALVVLPAAAAAQDPGNLINQPGVSWTVYGALAQSKPIRDKDVRGGWAMRVTVTAKGANAYDAGAQTPITRPVRKGDRLVFAFYARAPGAGGDGKAHVHALVQQSAAPYAADFQDDVAIGPGWEMVHITGAAQADHPAGSILGALQVAGDKQVLDLGPAFVMDLGPG